MEFDPVVILRPDLNILSSSYSLSIFLSCYRHREQMNMKLRKQSNCYQQQSSLVLQEASGDPQTSQISLVGSQSHLGLVSSVLS